jgi:hypothetical protein
MGFCYTQSGQLCCDVCGNAGGVRKIKCPVNWCQATATCESCKPKVKAFDHSSCRESVARKQRELAEVTQGRAHLVLYSETSRHGLLASASVGALLRVL